MEVDYEQQLLRSLVQERSVTLLEIVQQMGPQLTDTDLEIRTGAVEKLSRIVALVPLDFLNASELSCLIDFFSARFLDHHSLIPLCLQAFKSISPQKHLTDADALVLADAIVNNQHFQVQSLRQPERLAVFQTLTNLFAYHQELPAILRQDHNKSNQILFGFIQSIDGEKDPRNLLLIFDLGTLIAASFDLAQLQDELFDVISCYFPIDFTPPPKQSDITADDLRLKLRRFFASNSGFYLQSVPLIVEKLSSSLTASRTEAADCLRECCITYPPSCLRAYLAQIWDALQSEMFGPLTGTSQHQLDECHFAKCLTALAENVGKDEATYQEFFRVVSSQLEVEFHTKRNHRHLKQTARVVAAILRGLLSKGHLERARSVANRYLAKYAELLLHCDNSTDRQGRLLLVQSVEMILAIEEASPVLDDKIADDLLSLLLGCATTAALLENQATAATTWQETAAVSLRSVAFLAKWTRIESLRQRAVDIVFELALSSPASLSRHCVACLFNLLRRIEPPSSENDCRLVERALEKLEKGKGGVCFDLIVAICCASPQPTPGIDLFIDRLVTNQNLQDSHSFAALLTIFEHHNIEKAEKLRPLLEKCLTNRQLESEPLRRLIALIIEPDCLISHQVQPSDIVNILSLSNFGRVKVSNDLLKTAKNVILEQLPSNEEDVSPDFCLNLSSFLVKCLGPDCLDAFFLENKTEFNWRGLVVMCHALLVASSAKSWWLAVDSLIHIMSSLNDESTPLKVASLFGKMFLPLGETGWKDHPRRLFERVSPLRRQAIVSRMAPRLAENVRCGRLNVIASLTLLTDLTKLSNNNKTTQLEPIWPSVVEQLSSIPTDRLAKVLALLSDNLKSILDSSDASRLVDCLLRAVLAQLTSNDDGDLMMMMMKEIKLGVEGDGDLQVRLAAVGLLSRLAQHSAAYPLLLGPVQRRIVRALKPCLSDHKRLVRTAAANAVNKWCCT